MQHRTIRIEHKYLYYISTTLVNTNICIIPHNTHEHTEIFALYQHNTRGHKYLYYINTTLVNTHKY